MALFYSRCDSCGKHKLIVREWHTVTDVGRDWADTHSFFDCWTCYIGSTYRKVKYVTKAYKKAIADTLYLLGCYDKSKRWNINTIKCSWNISKIVNHIY